MIPSGVAVVEVACLPGTPPNPVTRVQVQAVPTVSATWQATGQTLASMCSDSPIPGFLLLPAVDQAGFVASGNTGVSDWAYTITTNYTLSDGTTGTDTGTVQVFKYQTPEIVWLSTQGSTFETAPTYPVGGLAVNTWVATYANLPTNLDAADAGYSVMVQADNRLYIWSGTAWPPNGQGFAASGPQGVQGIQGNAGPANSLSIGTVATGSPASVTITGSSPAQVLNFVFPEGHWWTGSGDPGTISAELNGDLYLDTSGTGNVWQLQSGTWVEQTSLKGPQGVQGIAGPANSLAIGTVSSGGSPAATITGTAPNQTLNLTLQQGPTGASTTWHEGSGVPASSLGNDGDMYLNGATGDVYGPKASGAWGSIVCNITGPSGAQATTTAVGTIQLAGILSGTATAPTFNAAAFGTTSTTACAGNDSRVVGAAPAASPTFTGSVTIPTPSGGDNSTKAASTAFVATALGSYAPLASPALTGTPTAPTPPTANSSTDIATTAFVQANLASYLTTSSASSTYAPLSSPALTGTPTVPTASSGTNSTQAASTAFVQTSALVTGGTTLMGSSQASAFTAAAGGFYPCSASSAAFTATLPTAPANGTRVTIMKTDSSTNAVTISRGGSSDVINVSGQTTLTLSNYLAVATLEYNAGIWYNQESSSPAHQTMLVQGGTRQTGYGDVPEGLYIPQAMELQAVQFRIGTADASGTSAAQLYTNTTNASTGTALSGASVASAAWNTANTKTLVTGPWVIAAGTYIACNVTTVGTTPGNRLYVDLIGVWL